jgi:hypothetical protein
MRLKEQVWQQVVTAEILAASSQAAWMRAIQQGAREIERAADWSLVDGVLMLRRSTGGKLYRIDDQHACRAAARPVKCCKHVAARRLIQRYVEKLGEPRAAMFAEANNSAQPFSGHADSATQNRRDGESLA